MFFQSLTYFNLDRCGDKENPVATFVANVFVTLDYAAIKRRALYIPNIDLLFVVKQLVTGHLLSKKGFWPNPNW